MKFYGLSLTFGVGMERDERGRERKRGERERLRERDERERERLRERKTKERD